MKNQILIFYYVEGWIYNYFSSGKILFLLYLYKKFTTTTYVFKKVELVNIFNIVHYQRKKLIKNKIVRKISTLYIMNNTI